MKNKDITDELDERSESSLPEVSLILIREPSKKGDQIKVVNLDDFAEDTLKKYYIDAVEKYGTHNVRYCKVLGTKIKLDVDFIE